MDYNENLNIINHCVNEYQIDNKKIILLLSISETSLLIRLSEADGIWLKTCDYIYLKKYKENMGFEGDWKSFFTTFLYAIKNIQGGEVFINKIKDKLYIIIYHPLTDEFKIKNEIQIENFFSYKSDEFKKLNFEFIIDLFNSKDFNEKKENKDSLGKKSITKINLKKQIKRKFNHNLINPNVKKRKEKGAKFTEDENF